MKDVNNRHMGLRPKLSQAEEREQVYSDGHVGLSASGRRVFPEELCDARQQQAPKHVDRDMIATLRCGEHGSGYTFGQCPGVPVERDEAIGSPVDDEDRDSDLLERVFARSRDFDVVERSRGALFTERRGQGTTISIVEA